MKLPVEQSSTHPCTSSRLADTYPRLGIETALKHYTADIRAFRNSKLPLKKSDPWMLERYFHIDDFNTAKAFRILVCGQAGVGKSTLINHVFGIDLVRSNAIAFDIHDQNLIEEIDQCVPQEAWHARY